MSPPNAIHKQSYSKLIPALLTLTLLFTSVSCTPADSITGQSLLGSSFGIPGLNSTFDYVIIGGGTAGLALANRLTISGTNTVAVIEAGSFYELGNGNQSQIPRNVWNGAGKTLTDANPLVDWMFETEPEMGIGGVRMHYTRGRCLGGSSARNHMVYHRATVGAYKKWADEVGDASYEWENWKRYFDRSTTFHKADGAKRFANSTPEYDPAGERARDGPVAISYPNWATPITSWILRATVSLGMDAVPGWIDGVLIGSSWGLRSMDPRTQVRESSETAYLRPALKRTNLIVYHSTMATKVLFNGTEAFGVTASTLGRSFQLLARKEVILSAGAFQSPQLLMLSGIGPRETLDKFKIPVLVDAPGVGQGMEDHPGVNLAHKVKVPSSTVLDTPKKYQEAIREYLQNGAGPLTSTGGEVVAWDKVPRRLISNSSAAVLDKLPEDWPDLEFLSTTAFPGPKPPDNGDYAGLTVVLVSTVSRGNVTISSNSIFDPPVINVNFLTHKIDQELAIAAIRRGREILAHASLEPVIDGPEVVPGIGITTDEQLLKYIQASGLTISHVSCTNKMGKEGDKSAVVDAKGKVFGVQRLRVIDVSAIPFLPPGHPMATVYALAEKLADDILG
ncbi:glucose-methanol-choline oxidoreductase [Dendryphion nanum]|uniref:Glucose-methanol-choline oxidoreductase n=1 Tax=Dendryphion nanum TaxID=256645 RepID=A0A9P9IEM3_9PLEO|nr:glucose-methanol-choline oxidoreductase [Dendryphion nanum]